MECFRQKNDCPCHADKMVKKYVTAQSKGNMPHREHAESITMYFEQLQNINNSCIRKSM